MGTLTYYEIDEQAAKRAKRNEQLFRLPDGECHRELSAVRQPCRSGGKETESKGRCLLS